MGPFLVFEGGPRSRAVPEGWAVRPLGDWDGHAAGLAYDPRRYQVMVARGVRWADIDGRSGGPGRPGGAVGGLVSAGWAPLSVDHGNGRSLWVRDLRAVGLADPRPPAPPTPDLPIGLER